jgi:allantoicase
VNELRAATFTGLVDLVSKGLGGRALGASDAFFAEASNLLEAGRGVFIEGKFTDRGKWMDGWESRRKRESGHDWVVLELGARGTVVGFDIDTHHFVGNHPPFASVDGLAAARGTSLAELLESEWTELLPQVPLLPDSQNLFASLAREPVTHLRLNIYPDGGVARLRAYGHVAPEWMAEERDEASMAHVPPGAVDLAAVKNGGMALACSDAFFGPMNNLLMPGRAENMGGGWETRRKRAPGYDWILVRLGARGNVSAIEVDTNHFKGNYPDRCSIDGVDFASGRITELIASAAWSPLLPVTKLSADTRHFFVSEITGQAPVSHVRLNIYPDGGVSRLRIWGERAPSPHVLLNEWPHERAKAALARCCGASRWVEGMLQKRPFGSAGELYAAATETWKALEPADFIEAFSHHPDIGADPDALRARFAQTASWSVAEQSGVGSATRETLEALRDANGRYRARFGYGFIVCATGKSASEMLTIVRARLEHAPERELAVAAGEQATITRLRLEKLAP